MPCCNFATQEIFLKDKNGNLLELLEFGFWSGSFYEHEISPNDNVGDTRRT